MTSVFAAKVKMVPWSPEDVDLPEGAMVTAVPDEPADDYAELTAHEEAGLEAAIAAADRDEGIPWATVRNELQCSHTQR